jgi:hypothetical protein
LIGLVLCVAAGCSAAADSPTAALQELHEYAEDGEWGPFYDRLTDRSRDFVTMIVSRTLTVDDARETGEARKAFVELLSAADAESYKGMTEMLAGKVVEERPEGEAVVLVVDVDGRENAFIMVKGEGAWRLDAFFDIWQATALRRGTTPDLEKKFFQCRTLLSYSRNDVAQSRRETGAMPTESRHANPLSPEAVAKQIVVIEQPGADGTTVDPSRAGWVWNSADEILHAAGYDEKTIKREKWERSRPESKQQRLRTLQVVARGKVGRAEPTEEEVRLQQWAAFGDKRPLRNPASPDDVATRITTITDPGADGASVSPSTAGWVWNAAGYVEAPSQ